MGGKVFARPCASQQVMLLLVGNSVKVGMSASQCLSSEFWFFCCKSLSHCYFFAGTYDAAAPMLHGLVSYLEIPYL